VFWCYMLFVTVIRAGGLCSVMRPSEDWLATTWVKVLGLCFQMTTEADLLEAAATLVFTVEFS